MDPSDGTTLPDDERSRDSRESWDGGIALPHLGSGEESLSGMEESDVESDTEGTPRPRRDSRYHPYDQLSEVQSDCLNFAMEHRIFLKAILGLLAERDKKATEIGMNDPKTLKSGPLKKASHLLSGVWKVKFVEVRRGMFSYYEDAASGEKIEGSLLRKNIPLDSNNCSCRAVKILQNGLNMAPGGAIFELKVSNQRRLWLAKSKAERYAWIQAINDAMVGGSVTQGSNMKQHGKSGNVNSKSPYKKDLKMYLKVKSQLKGATTKQEYISGVSEIADSSLDIPIQWLMEQMDSSSDTNAGEFQEGSLARGVEQLWRDLRRDTIKINEELLIGDGGHGPEKILGALTRRIVETSRSASTGTTKYAIPESRAVAYARDILLSINRTRSGGDSYFCVDTLVNNPDLVVTVPSSGQAEPLSVSVELDNEDVMDYSANDKSGWIRTRKRIQMSWRKRFFVLSEGTLSLYRHATPRPHGFRGQMVVTGATLVVEGPKDKPGFSTILIETKDGLKDRFLYFSNDDKLLGWAYALECTAKGSTLPSKPTFSLRNPKDSPESSLEDSNLHKSLDESMKMHAARLGVATEEIQERLDVLSAKQNSRVKILVRASTEYNICTTDPQGDSGDTWATIRATFLQTFRTSGDRIARGEEIVNVEVTSCPEGVELSESLKTSDEMATPVSPRRKIVVGRRRRSTG